MKNLNNILLYVCTVPVLVACNSGTGTSSGANQPIAGVLGKSTLVQNGVPVTDPRLNSMVPLIYISVSSTSGEICTGTLLDSKTILTASHCVLDMAAKASNTDYTAGDVVDPAKVTIFMTGNLNTPLDVNNQNSLNNARQYSVNKIYVHKDAYRGAQVLANDAGFNITNAADLNDLAILKLGTAVANPNGYSYPVLATLNPKTTQQETIAGYGVDSGNGVVLDDPDNGQSGLFRSAVSYVNGLQAGGMLINVGGNVSDDYSDNYYTKICQGDSGGPDFIDNGTTLTITGVHSYGDGSNCGGADTPATSVSVASYYNWITQGYQNYHI